MRVIATRRGFISYLKICSLVLPLLGCAGLGEATRFTNSLPAFEKTGEIPNSMGVIVLSTGRDENPCDTCQDNPYAKLPFISYVLESTEAEGNNDKRMAFIPAEDGFFSQLNEGYLGFIHLREVPAGLYKMQAYRVRDFSGGSINIPVKLPFYFDIEIQPGVVNYLGQLVITRGDSTKKSSISLSREKNRDMNFAISKYPRLKAIASVDIYPK